MQPPRTTDSELSMTEDFDWARRAPEVQQNPEHFGKLVVVHHKRILAVGRQRETLLAQAADTRESPAGATGGGPCAAARTVGDPA